MAAPQVTHSLAERAFYDGPPVALLSWVVVELLVPGTATTLAGWPIVLSLVFVGMPHGAVDFYVNSQLHAAANWRNRLSAFSGYLFALLGSLAFFLLWPVAALAAFLFLSGLHFGLADARDIDRRTRGDARRALTALAALARGSLIVALPLWIAPHEVLVVFSNILSVVGDPRLSLDEQAMRAAASVGVATGASLQLAVVCYRLRYKQRRALATELRELSVIVLAFSVLHPLFAMGLYVLVWHSWRHLQVLMQLDQTDNDGLRALLVSVCNWHRRALPLLLPTLAIFAGLAWWRLESWTSPQLAALTIAIFVVVTPPHHLLVEQFMVRMKRRPADSTVSVLGGDTVDFEGASTRSQRSYAELVTD